MCTRYFIELESEDAEEIREIMAELNRRELERAGDARAPAAVKRGEVFPSEVAAVVAADGPRAMRWGFSRPDGRGLVLNARGETHSGRPMFQSACRCLVPASCYFEWAQQGKEKIKFRIGHKNRPIFMAGLFRMEKNIPVFCVLTRPPIPEIAFIHDRMPVLLPPSSRSTWLRGAPANEALDMAVPDITFEREDGQLSLF